MTIGSLIEKLFDIISMIKYFPMVLSEYPVTSISSFLFFLILSLFLRRHFPVFLQHQPTQGRSLKGGHAKDEGFAFIVIAFISTYITYQYVVHGNKFITIALYGIIFAFFGQIYNSYTKLVSAPITSSAIAGMIGKVTIGMISLSTAAVMLATSNNYWHLLPTNITSMNYAQFLGYLFSVALHSDEWTLYVMQQAGGVALRLIFVYMSFATIAYHIMVRFPSFCSRHQYSFRHLQSFDRISNYVLMFFVSVFSNEMLKGAFMGEVIKTIQEIGNFLFSA